MTGKWHSTNVGQQKLVGKLVRMDCLVVYKSGLATTNQIKFKKIFLVVTAFIAKIHLSQYWCPLYRLWHLSFPRLYL